MLGAPPKALTFWERDAYGKLLCSASLALSSPQAAGERKSYWPNYSEVSEHPENLALPET